MPALIYRLMYGALFTACRSSASLKSLFRLSDGEHGRQSKKKVENGMRKEERTFSLPLPSVTFSFTLLACH